MNDNFTENQDRKLNHYLDGIRKNKDKIDKEYLIKLYKWSKEPDSQEERAIREAVYWFTWVNFANAYHLIDIYICPKFHTFEYDVSFFGAFKIQGLPVFCPICKHCYQEMEFKKIENR